MSLENLQYHKKHADLILASEDIGNGISRLVTTVVPNIVADMKSYFSSIDMSGIPATITGKQKDFLKCINEITYINLSPITIYCPEGLKVTYNEYLVELQSAALFAENIIDEMNNYNHFLGTLVNNPDAQKDTNFIKNKFNEILKNQNDITVGLGNCFQNGSVTSEVPYSKLLRNNSSWINVFEMLESINKRITSIDRKIINKKINEATELLDIIERKAKNNELADLSPEMLGKISSYTFTVARYLEFYSATYYQIKVITTSVNQSVDKLIGICDK